MATVDKFEDLKRAEKEMEKIQVQDEVTDEICPNCGRNMVATSSMVLSLRLSI